MTAPRLPRVFLETARHLPTSEQPRPCSQRGGPVCCVCNAESPRYKRGRCERCYDYWRAHKTDRPTDLGALPAPVRYDDPTVIGIPLTRGKITLVDADDYGALAGYRWYYAKGYAARSLRSAPNAIPRHWAMHRQILTVPPGYSVDHINHDTLDNRRANLRPATPAEQARNQRPRRDTTSSLKGVSWHGLVGRWAARIRVDGRLVVLGYFATEVEAGLAYDRAAREAFREFAYLNFPEEA